MVLQAFVHQHGGDETNKLEINDLNDECTVLDLKQAISAKIDPPCGADAMKVVFRGKILKDDQQLVSYGFATGMTVHVVRSRAPAAPAPVAAATGAAAATSPPTPATGVGAQTGAFPSPLSPFRSFDLPGGRVEGGGGGGRGIEGIQFARLPGAGPPDSMASLSNQLSDQFLQNPQMMQGIMNSPMFQQLLSNPQAMSGILSSNPRTRALMESNPEMRRAMEDPETLRTMMAAGTNPNLMAELQRNQDRALSNIEGMPGGFNALRRMYTDVAAPLEEGLRETIAPSRETTETPSTLADTDGPAVPNPWGAPSAGARIGGGVGGADPFAGMFGGGGGLDPFGGLGGGGGMGGPGGMGGMAAMMQNPAMMQMMTQMMQDPAFMRMAEAQNPALRQMLDSQPGVRDMLRNPAFLQMAMNPQVMQMAAALNQQRGLGAPGLGPFGGMPGFPVAPPAPSPAPAAGAATGTGTAAAPGGGMAEMLQMLQTMNGGGGWGGGFPSLAPPPDPRPPAERFAGQLGQMRDMGFSDDAQSLRALEAVHGNVQMAVERILDGRI